MLRTACHSQPIICGLRVPARLFLSTPVNGLRPITPCDNPHKEWGAKSIHQTLLNLHGIDIGLTTNGRHLLGFVIHHIDTAVMHLGIADLYGVDIGLTAQFCRNAKTTRFTATNCDFA